MTNDFYQQVADALYETDPALKCSKVRNLHESLQIGRVVPYADHDIAEILPAGRPEAPRLVHPNDVPRRGLGSKEGILALVHAICHIEFNAINLGLDAAYRFRNMPRQFYKDWISVANDEAKHFGLLAGYLEREGSYYGAFEAHSGLWDSAERTAHDPLIRMALVPRVLEARGLDVTPGIINKLKQAKEEDVVAMLHIILEEEEGHVLVGNHWYRYLCNARNLPPKETFFALLDEYGQTLKPPFNIEARLRSGFTQEEIDFLVDSIDLK
ncbi:ferritin-like domain-containing protein [Ignatzschineria larvae DSM 13226]|uniref:Ferritin-like domain-containing protein n=1 Tax=Ignatzschineria larvae DSM 13226 TaxID=1111732 RepID=A0ABZ3C0C5_9GAMM